MSAPDAAVPERKKSNKPLIFILVGCGGCLLLSGVAVVVLAVMGALGAKRVQDDLASGGGLVGLQLVAQQMTLASHMMNDKDRSDRINEVYDELYDMADAGELKSADVKRIQDELDKAEKDKKITGDEADAVLDIAEDVVGN